MINEQTKQLIKEHALENPKIECCGLIKQDQTIIRCVNRSESPEDSFIIKEDSMPDILAFYHSHVDGPFSEADKVMSEKSQTNAVLYSIATDSFDFYKPVGYQPPYENRPYLLSILDCYTLVMDYYKRELGVILPEIENVLRVKEVDWVNVTKDSENFHFLITHFKNNGFIEVSGPQKHDVIITSWGHIKGAIHSIIYLGNERILHHPAYELSLVENYKPSLKRKTLAILRYNKLT
jgi:proteasome lid subunit RPN8/RPN11